MSNQTNFFEETNRPSTPGSHQPQVIRGYHQQIVYEPGDSGAAQPQSNDQKYPPGYIPRIFIYNGQHYEDPGPEFTVEDVLAFLAKTFPELRQGTYTSRTLGNGQQEYTLVKSYGEKGNGRLSVGMIVHKLSTETHPTAVKAVQVVEKLGQLDHTDRALTVGLLLQMSQEIEEAAHQGEALQLTSQRILLQCLSLKPTSHQQIPFGF
jgi:PRTRC genetic system protein C